MKKAFLTGLAGLAAAVSLEASVTLPESIKINTLAPMENSVASTTLDLSKPFVLERPAEAIKVASHYSHSSHASHASHSSHYSSRY